jgi:hypothetical protein
MILPLPEPANAEWLPALWANYSPADMRAYGEACVAAERERCAVLRAMEQQVVDADDRQELTQQLIDLLRESLQVFK